MKSYRRVPSSIFVLSLILSILLCSLTACSDNGYSRYSLDKRHMVLVEMARSALLSELNSQMPKNAKLTYFLENVEGTTMDFMWDSPGNGTSSFMAKFENVDLDAGTGDITMLSVSGMHAAIVARKFTQEADALWKEHMDVTIPDNYRLVVSLMWDRGYRTVDLHRSLNPYKIGSTSYFMEYAFVDDDFQSGDLILMQQSTSVSQENFRFADFSDEEVASMMKEAERYVALLEKKGLVKSPEYERLVDDTYSTPEIFCIFALESDRYQTIAIFVNEHGVTGFSMYPYYYDDLRPNYGAAE